MHVGTEPDLSGRRAVAAVFAASGMLMATWFVRVPVIQLSLSMSDAMLGLALSAMSLGVIVAMPVVGGLASVARGRTLVVFGALLASAMLIASSLVSSVAGLLVCLIVYGLAYSCVDVGSNAHGLRVQATYGRSLMVGFHAWWSIGSLVGAGLGALSLAVRMSTAVHFALVSGGVAMAVLVAASRLRLAGTDDAPPVRRRPFLALPRGPLLPIAIAGFGIAIGESLGRSWSGVFLRDAVEMPTSQIGWGLVVLNVSMVAVRLIGDRVTDRLGASRTLAAGAWVAAFGVLLAAAIPAPATALLGFLLLGAGVGAGIPLCFATAGRRATSAGQGIASVATLAYAAFLIGSPVVGTLNDWIGIRWSLVVGALVLVAAAGRPGGLGTDERPAPDG